MNLGNILSVKGRGIFSVPPGTRVDEVMRGMRDRNVGIVLVVDHHGALKGVVSERDVVRCLASRAADGFGVPVEEIMTRDVITCEAAADAHLAVELMGNARIRHLPVVSNGELLGVLSSRDVFAYLAKNASMEEVAQFWTRVDPL